jgi:hypothetical protein
VFFGKAVLGLENKILKIAKCVRLKVGEEGSVMLMLESVSKRKLVERNFFGLLRIKFI